MKSLMLCYAEISSSLYDSVDEVTNAECLIRLLFGPMLEIKQPIH